MKKTFWALAPVAIVAMSSAAMAYPSFGPRVSDTDLSPRRGYPHKEVSTILAPDATHVDAGSAGEVAVQLLRQDLPRSTRQNQAWAPLAGLPVMLDGVAGNPKAVTDLNGIVRFSLGQNCKPGTNVRFVAALEDNQVGVVHDSRHVYQINAPVACGSKTQLLFKSDSDAGQALGIWQIAFRARAKLAKETGLAFWNRKLPFIWPSDGDYYDGSAVNITRGDYWDVVGHEMGHAVYDMAGLGLMGGGEHKIDQCYSVELALSEGWASFYSAWVSIDLADPDARFQYMVPRRAPIRFENIPDDVCAGQSNEWRVTGFFWDLIDLHDDGEKGTEPFARLFHAMERSNSRSASDAANYLQKAGVSPDLLKLVWMLNFKNSPVAF